MTANGAACPSCQMDAVMCIGKEMRTGGPCCADCRMQFVQRPMHVWATATVGVTVSATETTEEGQ